MVIYFTDEMTAGKMHDHMNSYSVKFWHTNEKGYRASKCIIMFIEQDFGPIDSGPNMNKIMKILKKRYVDPDVISVKYQ